MSENWQDLLSKLAKVQALMADAEAQLFEKHLAFAHSLISEYLFYRVFANPLHGTEIISFDWIYLCINDASATCV